jgi:hypothetical protein
MAMLVTQLTGAPPAAAGFSYIGPFSADNLGDLAHPLGLTSDDVGNVYAADSANHRIVKFDKFGRAVLAFGQGGSDTAGTDGHLYYPGDVVFANDHIYVADTGGHDIQVFTTGGAFVKRWGSGGDGDGLFGYANGITTDCVGNIYVANAVGNGGNVQQFDGNGTFVKRYGIGDLAVPVGIAASFYAVDGCHAGYVFVADEYAGRIAQYANTGQLLRYIGSPGRDPGQLDHPDQVAVDLDNATTPSHLDLLVAESGSFRVQRFRSTDGGQTWASHDTIESGAAHLNAPHGVTVTHDGRILVADTGSNSIYEYKDEPPALFFEPRKHNKKVVKQTEGLFYELSYNQQDKTCQVLVKATVTVPPRAAHVFTVRNDALVDDGSTMVKVDLSHHQVELMKEAWSQGRRVDVAAKAIGNCTGGVRVTKHVDYDL